MTPTLLLTRPEGRNASFAAQVGALWTGPLDVITSPLLEIAFVAASQPLADALIFTSVNGVAAAVHLGLNNGQVAWCVGGRTAEAAHEAGFAIRVGPGDANSLLDHIISAQPTGRLAHIRGIHARGDVAEHLNEAGLICEDVVAYDQLVRELSEEAKIALSGTKPVVAPLFSPRTATILVKQGPFAAPLHVVAMSEAVSEAISTLSIAGSTIAEKPDAPSMARAVKAALGAAAKV